MYGRNVYGTTKWGSTRSYSMAYNKTLTENVTSTDSITKVVSKSLSETVTNTDSIAKLVLKILSETVTNTDSIITVFKSAFRKARGFVSSRRFSSNSVTGPNKSRGSASSNKQFNKITK